MKAVCIKLLLLLSLSFNIAHAAFIAVEDDHTTCQHNTVTSFIAEQSADTECGDLCELHHLFHFMAIVDTLLIPIDGSFETQTPLLLQTLYHTAISQRDSKPPIYI